MHARVGGGGGGGGALHLVCGVGLCTPNWCRFMHSKLPTFC